MRLMEVIARLNGGGGVGTPTSWRSSDTPDDNTPSLSPTSTNTPSSDLEQSADLLSYTIGVTENTPYACHFCEKAFPRLSYLKRHEQVHSDQMPFKCDFCQRLFKHKRSRDRHVKLHTGDRKYRCTQCEAAFSRSDHLKIHMKTHDNGKPYQCPVCNRGYNTAAALTSHMQNHKKDDSQAFRCNQCPSVVLSTAKELQAHILGHVDRASPITSNLTKDEEPRQSNKCSLCREQFSTLEALIRHRKVHEETEKEGNSSSPSGFACGFCRKSDFTSLDSLQVHMKKCHSSTALYSDAFNSNNRDDIYKASSICTCEHVNFTGRKSNSASPHYSNPNSPLYRSDEKCKNCNKYVAAPVSKRKPDGRYEGSNSLSPIDSKRFLQASPRQIHVPNALLYNGNFPVAGSLLCSQCNAALPDFESFRTHLKTHLDSVVKKFSCKECEGEFLTEEMLDVHVANHYLATTTEYGCQCCLKMFNKPDQLQKHLMDIHSHQLYRCALCKEMFDSKVSIQVHFAVKHSNECHFYKCTSCTVSFNTDLEFQLHVKVAHLSKVQPFRCLLCDMCFSSEIQLQLHLHTHKKQFSCSYCDDAFHVEFLLDRHIQESHSGETSVNCRDNETIQNLSLKSRANNDAFFDGKKNRCDICDASFGSDTLLNNHRKQMHNIRTTGSQKPGQATLSLFCAYCNESCKSRTELEHHMKSHTISPTKHKCNICDEMCPSASTLAEHKLSHCKVVTGSMCISCHVVLKTEDQFYDHLHQHNSQGLPAPCVVCRQTLMSDIELQVHARFHLKNSEPLYSCCVCGKQSSVQHLIITGTQDSHSYMCKDCFHTKGVDGLRCSECHVKYENLFDLEQHKSTTHRKTYQCIKCQMSFETEAEIQMHVASHVMQEGTNHGCHLCPKVFDSPAKLQCHLIEHTFEGCSSYSCYMCSAVYTSSHLIQQHMLEHGLDSRPYDCSSCHQKFFFRAELENHMFLHRDAANFQLGFFESTDGPEEFTSSENVQAHKREQKHLKCSLCSETFDTTATMQQHYFHVHGDSKPQDSGNQYPCPECDKVFPCMSNLQGHLRTHNQEAKYTCPECKKEFALARNLHIHMRSHNGDKPYECPVCKKRFARKENRRAHLKSHSGLKPFTCPHCAKSFSRKCHMKEHMRTHITSTTHPCELCTESFPDTSLLRRHLVDVHQKKFDFSCSVCKEVFEHLEHLDQHMCSEHEVRTDSSSPMDDLLSESSMGQSSTSGDITKDEDMDSAGSTTNSSNVLDDQEPISVETDCEPAS